VSFPKLPYTDIFTLPTAAQAGGVASGSEHFYSFDYANAHFVVLDPDLFDAALLPIPGVQALYDQMMAWLPQDVSQTQEPWLIAFFHHPPYSKGSHDSDSDGILDASRSVFVPILEGAGVDLVLCGHSHNYERSMLIDGHYGPSPEFRANPAAYTKNGGNGREDGDGAYIKPATRGPHQGTVYVVSGNSGGRGDGALFPLDYPAMVELADPHTGLTQRGLMSRGSLVLDLDGSRLDAQYLDFDGEVLDHFTILKGAAAGTGGASSGGVGGASSGGMEGSTVIAAMGGGASASSGESAGCGCRVMHPAGVHPGALLVGVLLLLARHRRRVSVEWAKAA
jgi:MYXO-CTERM domain-containing protein